MRIDRERLHNFVEQRCDEVERKGDWVKEAPLTALQEEKLRELKGDTLALSLAEGIAYRIGNFLIFHADEFLTLPKQLGFDK